MIKNFLREDYKDYIKYKGIQKNINKYTWLKIF